MQPFAKRKRQQLIATATCIIGAATLASLPITPRGSFAFFPISALLALIWLAGSKSIIKHVSFSVDPKRAVVLGALAGTVLIAACLIGAFALQDIPEFRYHLNELIDHAENGPFLFIFLVALVNGFAEELFFRNALFTFFKPENRIAFSTIIYTLVVSASSNIPLTIAAFILGLTAAIVRKRTGNVLAPISLHAIWTTGVLILFPLTIGTF